jgi:hypothetical protein
LMMNRLASVRKVKKENMQSVRVVWGHEKVLSQIKTVFELRKEEFCVQKYDENVNNVDKSIKS